MRRQADIAGRPPEEWRHKVRKAAGDLLRGSRGTRGHPHHGFDGTFAGKNQAMGLLGPYVYGRYWEGTMGARVACDPGHHRQAQQHRRLVPERRRALRRASHGIPTRLLGWPRR